MWKTSNANISMTVGDYGIELPVTVSGVEFGQNDSVRFRVANGSAEYLDKVFGHIADNTFKLMLTKSESDGLPVGQYRYSLDWFRDNAFMCNIIPSGEFKVVGKA